MSTVKFYIDTYGTDDQAYLEAIQAASAIADKDSEIKKVILLIHTKSNTGWFERLFGSDGVKLLFNGTTIKGMKPPFRLETKTTYKDGFSPSDVVIICGWDSEDVFKIDDYHSAKYIIAIPWVENGISDWVKTWGAKELRGKAEEVYALPSCIVQKAMEDLTSSINMSTGITHPSDENLAKTYILALHKYEKGLRSDLIAGYLVNGLDWETDDAKQVKKLIDTLNSGKFFKGGDRSDLKRNYQRWKAECK